MTRTRENRTGCFGEVLWLAAYVAVGSWLIDQLLKLW